MSGGLSYSEGNNIIEDGWRESLGPSYGC